MVLLPVHIFCSVRSVNSHNWQAAFCDRLPLRPNGIAEWGLTGSPLFGARGPNGECYSYNRNP